MTVSVPVDSSGSIPDPIGWSEPEGWTGPEPVLYWSFDTLDGLTLMEKTQQADFDALTDYCKCVPLIAIMLTKYVLAPNVKGLTIA